MTTSDNELQRVLNEGQRVTTNDNEWYNKWQRVTVSSTTSDNKWQPVVSKIERFIILKETKNLSSSRIVLLNFLCNITTIRNSRSQMLFEIGVLKICNIHRKTSVVESLFSKVAALKACNFFKMRLQHRCFPVNIAKLLRKFYV